MGDFYFSELKHHINIETFFHKNELGVVVKSSDTSLVFACYVLSNGGIYQKTNYQKNGSFNFTLDKSMNVAIKVYIRSHLSEARESKLIKLGFFYIESTYHKKYLKKIINLKNAEYGKKLINENKLLFPTFKEAKITNDNFFYLDPFKNRTWRWFVHQLFHISYIISYYELISNNNKDLQYIIKNIKDWSYYSQNNNSIDDLMLWHDHGTALRLTNLCISFSYLLKKRIIRFGTKDYNLILDLIKQHIDKLMEDSFYSKNTNHGFDQSLSLYQAALEFEYILPNMNDVIVVAEERLINEINFAFCEDGGHKENSPGYLNFGIKQCLHALEIASNYNKVNELSHINNIVNNATKVLTYTVKPDGFLPLIGDTTKYKVTDFFTSFKPENYSEFKYAITLGGNGSQPKSKKLILPDTGYAFYRSHWDKNNFSNAIYLSFKASYHSNYHRHDDDLSITLFAYGQDWLVDGGLYKYDERNPNRRYIRSHFSHNILTPDNGVAQRNLENRHKVHLTDLSKSLDQFHVAGMSEMFQGFKNKREVLVVENEEILIKDKCESSEYDEFTATSRLFFPINLKVELNDNLIVVKGVTKELNILVTSNADFSINLSQNANEKVKGRLSDTKDNLISTNLVEIQILSKNNSAQMEMKFKFI